MLFRSVLPTFLLFQSLLSLAVLSLRVSPPGPGKIRQKTRCRALSQSKAFLQPFLLHKKHAEILHHKEGWTAKDAAFDAGKRRMVPIFLTSATTAVGVVPMILSGSTLWTPLGAVICIGTIVSMLLVVTVLPVMYWKIYGNK